MGFVVFKTSIECNMEDDIELLQAISKDDAAKLLVTDSALGQLSFEDARQVVGFMKPKLIKAGATLIRQGEKVRNDYMMLILAGDVSVESQATGASDQMVVSIMAAGSLIGEMGMIDGAERSATCVAASDLAVAVLSRDSLKQLIAQEPALAARFLLAVSARMAERLRDTTSKLKKFIQLNAILQKEVFLLMDAKTGSNKSVPATVETKKKVTLLNKLRR
jgi:CRP/FNR family transcriptional regulator, cyclic AMP receptor protein